MGAFHYPLALQVTVTLTAAQGDHLPPARYFSPFPPKCPMPQLLNLGNKWREDSFSRVLLIITRS